MHWNCLLIKSVPSFKYLHNIFSTCINIQFCVIISVHVQVRVNRGFCLHICYVLHINIQTQIKKFYRLRLLLHQFYVHVWKLLQYVSEIYECYPIFTLKKWSKKWGFEHIFLSAMYCNTWLEISWEGHLW